MKTKKILLSVLLCLVMVMALCLAVACNKEVKIDLSDATQWGPAVAEGEEDIYQASKNSEGNLVFDFAKNDSYNATKIAFASFDVKQLANVKTLVVTAKMTTDAPYPALLFKVEGTDDPASKEVKVKATEDFTTYEWDFEGYDLTKVTRFLIFADPGVVGSSGKIVIKEIYLTSNELNAANDAKDMPAEEGKAPDPVWNEVTASKKNIGNWVDGTANRVYTVTANNDGSYKVDVHKKIGAGNWDALISYIHGDALKQMKSFKLVVKGTAGKQILVKPFDNFEKRVTLTGENQEVVIDVHTVTEDATKDFSRKDAPTAENKVCIMGLPDVNTGNDTLTIISAEFSTEAVAPVVDETVNEITTTNHKITKGWEGLDAGTYTVTADGTALKVEYSTSDYKFLRTYVKGAEIANMKTIVFTVKGTAGDKILFKPFDQNSLEAMLTLTGGDDVVTIDVSAYVADKTFADKAGILLCANPGGAAKTGEFKLISVEFSANAAPVDPNLNTITNANKAITKWYGEDVYTITHNQNGTATVAKSEAGWQQLKADVKGADIANFTLLRVKLSSVNGVPFVVKCWDNTEYCYDGRDNCPIPTTNDVVVEVAVPAGDYSVTKTLLVFINAGEHTKAEAVTVTISAEFGNPVNEITSSNKKVIKWYGESVYTITPNQDGTVSVVKAANGSWAQVKANVTGADIANMKTFKIKIIGDANAPIIIKPYNNNAVQQEVTCTGEEQEIICDLTKYDGSTLDYTTELQILIFYNWDGATESNFKIVSAEFSTDIAPAA